MIRLVPGVGRVRIGELATATGTTARALRHYEQAGLISSERAANGYRVYDETAVVRVRNIRYLLAAGLTLEDVQVFLPCLDGDVAAAPPSGKGLRVALDRLAVLNERIAAQTEARDRLAAALRERTGGRVRPVA
ncbi:DNA-binding transcriptional regulator, MerR family [Streptoalloteichus hindustanus]|uniref:DNA-binding transcriptional regulator, MerR family n=1 Tax=Streptoalloteichus hindustanus TaxID=2017 RepID=A0A1M5I2X0_STRHI|nr:DNA-binding transcriptional regulator, MerR family [Streptoalloteichus hindustanus]